MPSSDSDEAPEQVSFKAAKTAVEKEQHLVNLQKQNEKKHAKLRRRLQQEVFLVQKNEKAAKLREKEELFSGNILDELRAEMALNNIPVLQNDSTVEEPPVQAERPVTKRRKIYKDLNIEVATLSGVQTGRATASAAFRTRRLAKAHRESPNMNLIHAEKLMAAGKL